MLRKLLITFFLIIPLALFAVLLMLYFWGPVLTFGPVVILILFFIKVRRQRMMLVLIQNALETDTPVEEVLEAYARTGWSPRYRNKVLRFAQNLRDGHSIASAAQACRGVLRHDAVGLIRLGGDTDQIGALLAQTVDEARRMSFVQLQSLIRLAWFCGYFPVMMVVPVFCMMWIMPKFEAIFMDFGTQLPASTISVLAISQFLIRYFPGIGTPLFVLIFLPFLYFIARSGILPYRPPGTRKMLRQLDAARFLRIFAAGLEMKKSIPEIVEPHPFNVPMRKAVCGVLSKSFPCDPTTCL